MTPNNIDAALREAAIQVAEHDTFILLATNARALAQRLMDVDEATFNRAYNDRVCAFKMGKPICSAEEAASYGIELCASVDEARDVLALLAVNIDAESSECTLFCHKYKSVILVELS